MDSRGPTIPVPTSKAPQPVEALRDIRPYATPAWPGPIDLRLDGNEGLAATAEPYRMLSPALLRRYPSRAALETQLAAPFGVEPDRVLVTAGADEAIDRLCRVMLGPGRTLVVPVPTFEMLPRYARLAGAEVITPAWDDRPFPLEEVLDAVDDRTGLIGVVSPNNPTGLTVDLGTLRRLSASCPHAVVLLDHAYVEFADQDLTAEALTLPNVVVVRTLSKAWGLAGLRVGYALGPGDIIGWMRPAGGPYAVAGPSLALASHRLASAQQEVDSFVSRVRQDRESISRTLRELGARVSPSEGNFSFARLPQAGWVLDALAGLGIRVRGYPGDQLLASALRITCPGDQEEAARVCRGLRTALAPEAILFDLDGVVVDVARSYRAAIIATAMTFGVRVEPLQIAEAKARGGANNDWDLTLALLTAAGVQTTREEVIRRFEAEYQGADGNSGLKGTETALIDRASRESMRTRAPP